MSAFQLFFQYREQVVVRRGQVRRIGWVIEALELKVDQFLLGCKCPVGRDIIVTFPRRFSFKMSFNYTIQQR